MQAAGTGLGPGARRSRGEAPRPSHQARAADWAAPARRSESADWAGALGERLARRRTGARTRSALCSADWGAARRRTRVRARARCSAVGCGPGSSKKIGPAPWAVAQAAMGLGPPVHQLLLKLTQTTSLFNSLLCIVGVDLED